MDIAIKDEWTQEEFLQAKQKFTKEGREVVLVDTILRPIDHVETVVYNPYELKKYPHGIIFVFYCDTGKETLERLEEFKRKFPQYHCVSLRGGRGYWRKNLQILDEDG